MFVFHTHLSHSSIYTAALFRGLFFGGYDNLKHFMDLHEASFLKRYVVAQALTTVVGTLCYPIDTIKRRMMIQASKSAHFCVRCVLFF